MAARRFACCDELSRNSGVLSLWNAAAKQIWNWRKARLARCRKLTQEFPDGLTAVNIRELETELRQQLQAIETSKTL